MMAATKINLTKRMHTINVNVVRGHSSYGNFLTQKFVIQKFQNKNVRIYSTHKSLEKGERFMGMKLVEHAMALFNSIYSALHAHSLVHRL